MNVIHKPNQCKAILSSAPAPTMLVFH